MILYLYLVSIRGPEMVQVFEIPPRSSQFFNILDNMVSDDMASRINGHNIDSVVSVYSNCIARFINCVHNL